MELPNVVLMLPNALLMAWAKAFMLATAPSAIRATTKAYSTRSWPSSRLTKFSNFTYNPRNKVSICLCTLLVYSPQFYSP